MRAIADTSFMLGYLNKRDIDHEACMKVFKVQKEIYLPQSTLAEIGYMLGRSSGNWSVVFFLRNLPAVAKFHLVALEFEDVKRTADILEKYADTRVDFVDATIVAVAERLKISRILTLDHRDFSLIRPEHVEHFELLPSIAP